MTATVHAADLEWVQLGIRWIYQKLIFNSI